MVNDPLLGGINERIELGSVKKNGKEVKRWKAIGHEHMQ
jgi:hypothetical protein